MNENAVQPAALPIGTATFVFTDIEGSTKLVQEIDVETASLQATPESGLPAMLLAASHPERLSALVLINSYARFLRSPDQPWGMPADSLERYVALTTDLVRRGEGGILAGVAPTVMSDSRTRE